MKYSILFFLLVTGSPAFAEPLPSDNVILPKHSQMTFLGENSENGAYEFKGQVSLKGSLVAGWVFNRDPDDMTGAHHVLELRFVPKKNQLALLPLLKEDIYRNGDRTITLTNGADEHEKLIKKHFNHIPNGFLENKEGVLRQEAVVTVDEYQTYVECDHRYFYVKLISVEKTTGNARLVGKGERYGQEFAVDFYTVTSKEGYTNLRRAPDKNARVLAKIPNNVTVEKIKTEGDWLYVQQADKPGLKGYVHKSQAFWEY